MSGSRFPAGWDEERARRVAALYDNQTDEEALAEDAAAFADPAQTVMLVPTALTPAILTLIAAYESACREAEVSGQRTAESGR